MSTDNLVTKSDLQEFYSRILPYLGGSADAGFTPVGTVISVMGKTAPANYLACDGSVYNIADYPELADYFLQQFESKNYFGGDGTTTFAVPDLQGEFLRGTGTNSHTNQGSGGEVGEHQDATEVLAMWSNTGKQLRIRLESTSLSTVLNEDATTLRQTSQQYLPSTTEQASESSYQGVRPTNTSVLFCIATKNIYLNPSLDFSTSEKVVGTWIDGKTLFQRTIVDTMPVVETAGTAVNKAINLGFLADKIVNVQGFIFRGGFCIPMPYTNYSDGKWYYAGVVTVHGNQSQTPNILNIKSSQNVFSNEPVYVTIQYTKASD